MTNNYRLPVIPAPWKSAYLAGMIDGDGSIMVRRRDKGKSKGDRARNISFILLIVIGGEPTHLRKLRAIWGNIGNIYIRKRKSQRHLALWTIASNQARSILGLVEPHLILKRRQAIVALSMPQPVTRWGVTPELRAAQERCRIKISNLNSRTGRGKARTYGVK